MTDASSTPSRPRAQSKLHIDNDRVRVTEWRFAPGAATGWHRHELDYVIVPLASGTLRLEEPEGVRHAELTHGVPYYRGKGVEHDVVNANEGEFAFLEIEMK
ncbi:MAG: cupin domain-containing protein [Candidatus Competibacterales bacterium]